MFYLEDISCSKGTLAKIWIASHMENKITRAFCFNPELNASIVTIKNNEQNRLALRLSGQLLLGIVRIYSKKAKYILDDCAETNLKIKLAFRPGVVDLPAEQLIANFNAITLPDTITDVAILVPNFEEGLSAWDEESKTLERNGAKSTLSRRQDITMQESTILEDSVGGIVGFEPYISTGEEPELDFGLEPNSFSFMDGATPFEPSRLAEAVRRVEQVSPMLGQNNPDLNSPSIVIGKGGPGNEASTENFHGSINDITNQPSFRDVNYEIPTALLQQGIDLTVPYVDKKNGVEALAARKRKMLFDSVTTLPPPGTDRDAPFITDVKVDLLEKDEEEVLLNSVKLGLYFDSNGMPNFIDEFKTKFAKLTVAAHEEFVPSVYSSEANYDELPPNYPYEHGGDVSNSILDQGDNFYDSDNILPFDPSSRNMDSDLESVDTQAALETTTLKVLQLLRQNLIHRQQQRSASTPIQEPCLDFDQLLVNAEAQPIQTKKAAVSAFYDLLVLKTKGLVDMHQDSPYQPIKVSQLPAEH